MNFLNIIQKIEVYFQKEMQALQISLLLNLKMKMKQISIVKN